VIDDATKPSSNGSRSAADRIAETRIRLLDAVIDTLAECGYAGTSTTVVARRSGLTRGAQQYHFGTKDQMMVAVIEYLGESIEAADMDAALGHLEGRKRVRAALSVMAQMFTGPVPNAYIELWFASRTNPELAAALKNTDFAGHKGVRRLFGDELIERAGPEFDALLDLAMFALRGMALDAHLVGDDELRSRAELIEGLAPMLERALGIRRARSA
jgi:AcrR family transcriptional regulator